eukprot:8077590-Heterocapsa_arctica.AAC.1
MATRKRQRLGDGVDILLPETEDCGENSASLKHNIGSYLTLLFSLLLAYARAGRRPLVGAPEATEDRSADSTMYIEVPLDVVLKYHGRAQNRAAQLPGNFALDW